MPSKHENGGKKRPAQIRAKKMWGKKCRQNAKVGAKSAITQMSEKKVMVAESAIKMEKWWRKVPPNKQSDGKKYHHFSNLLEQCGGVGF